MAERERASGRAVLVTGASTGIGEASALRLDALGWRVFAGVRRDEDAAALRERASERLTPLTLDVTDAAQVAAAARAVDDAVGAAGLAGLVNNAGIAVAAPLEFLPIAELRRQLEVNVVGQVAVTQALLPSLRRARGRIVNIGSMSGLLSAPFLGAYGASKFAIEALTDALRVELRPWGLEVVVIEPGGIATPIWDRSLQAADRLLEAMPPQLMEYYGPVVEGMRRMARHMGKSGVPVGEVADVVVHALSARRPRTRYRVGRGTWLTANVIARLPDRLRDRMIAGRLPKYP